MQRYSHLGQGSQWRHVATFRSQRIKIVIKKVTERNFETNHCSYENHVIFVTTVVFVTIVDSQTVNNRALFLQVTPVALRTDSAALRVLPFVPFVRSCILMVILARSHVYIFQDIKGGW